jgi:hypothetical protein
MAELWLSDPDNLAHSLRTLPERFWSKVEKGPSCWTWTGTVNRLGYGHILVGLGMKKSTHVALFLETGEWLPEGSMACHRCDNPSCVNPAHLFIGDALANNRDRQSKGRTISNLDKRTVTKFLGEANGCARLNEENVRAIRSSPESGPVLAGRYGVSVKTISRIRRREKWAHVA